MEEAVSETAAGFVPKKVLDKELTVKPTLVN